MSSRGFWTWWVVGLVLWPACGDTGGGQGTPDAGDVSSDGSGDATFDADSGDVLQVGDSWIDGSYLDGREGPPPEQCANGVDDDQDGQTDCDDSDCAARLICQSGLTAEHEPNDKSNQGQMLSLPMQVSGGIAAYTTANDGSFVEDVDWYRFQITEPTLVRWELDDANGLAIPILTLVGLEDATASVVRQLDGTAPGAVRQAYLPVAGMYGIQVRDRRNTSRDADEFPYGGPGFEYAFSLEALTLEAQAASLPIERTPSELEPGNALPVLRLSVPAGQVFEAQVWGDRLSPSSGLDSILYLVDATDRHVVGWVDDAPLSTNDPLLRTGILAQPLDALLIVDAYRIAYTSDYELAALALDPSQDREPNDPIGLAFPARAGDTIAGEIGAPFLRSTSIVRDADYYVFPGGPGASYHIEVTPQGADLDAAVRTGYLYTSNGRSLFGEMFQADPPDGRGVSLDAASLVNADFYVEVTDRRNSMEDNADPVGGGSGFDYTLEVTGLARDIQPLDLPASETADLSQPGEADWYELTVPARTRLEVSATEQSEGVEPWVYLTLTNDLLVLRASRTLAFLNTLETTYRLGVIDRRAGGGDGYGYDLSAVAQPYTVVAEVEPNNGPPEGGQTLSSLPEWVDGAVTGTNQDTFDPDVYVVDLTAGQHLVAETTFGADTNTDDADTSLSIQGPGLDAPLTDADGGYGWFSRLEMDAPQTGAYEITVTPWCNADGCRAGDYSLAVWTTAP